MAVFTEAQLAPSIDRMSILDKAVYLESNATMITSKTVPVVENKSIESMVVRFDDVRDLAEAYGVSYIDAMTDIVNENGLNPESFVVAVDEATIIENPDIVNELTNVVVNPISESSLAYLFCESMISGYEETGDEEYLTFLAEEDTMTPQQKKNQQTYYRFVDYIDNLYTKAKSGSYKNEFSKYVSSDDAKKSLDKFKSGTQTFGKVMTDYHKDRNPQIAAHIGNVVKVMEREIDNAPRTWLAKKVASLRSLYGKYLLKAQAAKDLGQAGVAKKIAAAILNVIDWIMRKIQSGANKVGEVDYRYAYGR